MRASEDRQAFVAGGGRQPRPEALGLADPPELLDEAQPDRLADVGSIGRAQPMSDADVPHQAGETLHDGVVGAVITIRGPSDQRRHVVP
ncbi:MAG: hypothetical protein WKF93_11530, partial [Acidimicrobiales bacterium]